MNSYMTPILRGFDPHDLTFELFQYMYGLRIKVENFVLHTLNRQVNEKKDYPKVAVGLDVDNKHFFGHSYRGVRIIRNEFPKGKLSHEIQKKIDSIKESDNKSGKGKNYDTFYGTCAEDMAASNEMGYYKTKIIPSLNQFCTPRRPRTGEPRSFCYTCKRVFK